MQLKRFKRAPVILAGVVLALVCALRAWNPDVLERAECMTYDLRVRHAQQFPAPVATNLAFVAMEDSSIADVNKGRVDMAIQGKIKEVKLGYHSGLYWQRHIYGRLVEELSGAGGTRRSPLMCCSGNCGPDHPQVQMADGSLVESDNFFALQMRQASNVIIAAHAGSDPAGSFYHKCIGARRHLNGKRC